MERAPRPMVRELRWMSSMWCSKADSSMSRPMTAMMVPESSLMGAKPVWKVPQGSV